jgi:hypothetical protein
MSGEVKWIFGRMDLCGNHLYIENSGNQLYCMAFVRFGPRSVILGFSGIYLDLKRVMNNCNSGAAR